MSGDGLVVGHGQYLPDGAGSAEVAFAVAEGWQGRGIATLLLAQLAEAAAADGVRHFTAAVLARNHRMIRTFRDSLVPILFHLSSLNAVLLLVLLPSCGAWRATRP